jgi:hypothetical protein
LTRDAARKEEERSGSNGAGGSRFGIIGLAHYWEGGRRNRGGELVFHLLAELVVVVVMLEHHWPSLFIGQSWQFIGVEIFLHPLDISTARAHAQIQSQFRTVHSYPCACPEARILAMAVMAGWALLAVWPWWQR